MSTGNVEVRLDPDAVAGLFVTKPAMMIYTGDFDPVALHSKIASLAAGAISSLPSERKRLECLDVVISSVLHVMAEQYSIEHLTHNSKCGLINKQSTEAAYERLESSFRSDAAFALALNRAWVAKLMSLLREETCKNPKLTVDEFVDEAAENFRVTGIMVARMLGSLTRPQQLPQYDADRPAKADADSPHEPHASDRP